MLLKFPPPLRIFKSKEGTSLPTILQNR